MEVTRDRIIANVRALRPNRPGHDREAVVFTEPNH
jgi:hypothetical protein